MIEGASPYTRNLNWTLVPASGPAPLLVVCHGFRQDRDFSLEAWAPLQDKVHLLAVEGPLVHETGRPRRIVHAWYVYDGDRGKLRTEFDITCQALDRVIADVSSQVEMTALWLGGFSQGAYLALYYGLAHNPAVSVVHAVAGNFHIDFAFESLEGRKVLLEHGNRDPTCPVERIEQLEALLIERGATVSRTMHEAKHDFTEAMTGSLKRCV